MIRFVNIENGNVFNGDSPYIFWMDGEQSINLWYNKPICFISKEDKVTVRIPDNEVFKLLKLKSWEKTSLDYNDIQSLIEYSSEMEMYGVKHRGVYVYMFYVLIHSDVIGEYVEDFYINDSRYKIGADFYGENEFNHINLMNLGIDIPDSIQKALYPANVREDKKDNIILNRKWKELLSNYWDVVANKGSYKSLYNSLKWFEYGDKIKLFELWKRDDFGKTVYEERSIKEILGDKFFETLNGFSKTTYLAISSALEQMVKENGEVKYDDEKNPKIEHVVQDWSIQDLSLKLSMLGNFYKTYFMPIHLDCIRSTIEDVIYSNTIKLINSSIPTRTDQVSYIRDFKCNIKDGDIFRLSPVSVRVGRDTMFGNMYNNRWSNYNEVDIVGVQREEPEVTDEEQLKTYAAQRFNAVGSIIDFKISLPLDNEDFIKRSVIAYKGDNTDEWDIIEDCKICGRDIEFSILCTKEQEYDIRLEFHSGSGEVFSKRITFNVIDTKNVGIKIYKIQNIRIPDLEASKINEYCFGRMLNSPEHNLLFKQYIPSRAVNPNTTAHWDYKGICLNHLLILRSSEEITDKYILDNYFTQVRPINDDLVYTICLSKQFGFKPNYMEIRKYFCYREEYVFYPDFHELIELGKGYYVENLSNYTITDADALCIVPDLAYGKLIEEAQWEFVNTSDPKKPSIIPCTDIKEPFVAPDTESFLKPGYYNIIFRYRLAGEDQVNMIELNSAFLKK